MRILVLSDIHANWAALSALDEEFDRCLFLGDLVDYGSDPAPCVDWVMEHAHIGVRGNHDHAVVQRISPRPGRGLRGWTAATRELQLARLTSRHLKYLSRLPLSHTFTLDGTRFHLVHATPRDPLDEYLPDTIDSWRPMVEKLAADIVCVGHTHLQFVLEVGSTRVLNPGSIGQPRDGDPRAAYAIIDNGRIELKRARYDIDKAVAHLRASGVDEKVVELADWVLHHGGIPQLDRATDL